MYPYNTEMDLSIAIAFYFASSCLKVLLKTILRINKLIGIHSFNHQINILPRLKIMNLKQKYYSVD